MSQRDEERVYDDIKNLFHSVAQWIEGSGMSSRLAHIVVAALVLGTGGYAYVQWEWMQSNLLGSAITVLLIGVWIWIRKCVRAAAERYRQARIQREIDELIEKYFQKVYTVNQGEPGQAEKVFRQELLSLVEM